MATCRCKENAVRLLAATVVVAALCARPGLIVHDAPCRVAGSGAPE
jgi:hypothetical protein